MYLHSIQNVEGAVRKKKRVGCGESSGHGKTSCRGTKGQMSRSGHKRKPAFEGGQMQLIRRIPKRGFNRAFREVASPVNVQSLVRFDAGTAIDPSVLYAAGMIPSADARVKILGTGELDRKLDIKAHAFSESARKKIEAAGGTCELLA
ncbi:MAG: 50S ribosomal protein L15 [Verrucomicrobia bacterium]|nr:50S ribosomal protein L15 [Kiritimatiellia bacterium]MCP5487368.1 50S ribosomal protein L15 [Verrucomicrobiota bacterium]